ncbi:2-dehydropantoate 2-reductase [Saliniradius amylolyticus]|uniref:2-dehydropantoate 2-reductase n=1 Tax=Saliniradius amylolyticus TaxID=2183582 RepID=A0A2S2E659_9ALTE|nr:2-dehydropantoate 2-reductase [Saliniradius amylolyticus]AWL12447.1 2-dehydropantoate 2-reductase [Saliniradius amylolyticus]
MRVLIAGQGAIGSVLAYRCELHGLDYRVLPRRQKQSIEFQPLDAACLRLPSAQQNPASLRGDELLLLPLKAYQVQSMLEQVSPYLSTQTLVLLHNGLGVLEKARHLAPECSFIQGITRLAAYKQQHRVTQTAQGDTHLSWVSEVNQSREQKVHAVLEELLSPVYWHQDLSEALWRKLVVNSVINPLTALHQVRNGQLSQPQYQAQIQTLIDEARALMQGLGIRGHEDLERAVAEVIEQTSDNYSSMYQDLMQQRPTEIDYINGYLCQEGQRLGIATPEHQAVLEAIHAQQAAT